VSVAASIRRAALRGIFFCLSFLLASSIAWAGKAPPNPPPTVAITSPANGATFTAPASIVLTASASDSNGTVAKVEFFRGKTLIGTASSAPYSVTWANVAAGSYTVTAKATDNGGASATSAGVAITVTSAGGGGSGNITIASPANNASVYGTSVTVSGTFVGTSTPAFVLLDNGASSRFATVTGNSYAGALPINVGANTVTASVERADRTNDKTNIAVNGKADPIVLITSPGSGALSAGANVTIAADALSPGGSIASVSFYKGSTLLGTATSPPYQYNWTNIPAGSYTLAATATDNQGHSATATQPLQVGPPNLLPSVSVTNPTPSAVFTAPASIKIDVTASDSDGTVTQVEFLQNGAVLGATNIAPYTFTWGSAPVGNYAITARATDNSGGVATSPAVNITVNSPPPVGMDSSLQGASFVTPAAVSLSASTGGPALGVSFYRVVDGFNSYIGDGTPTNGGSPYTLAWNVRTAGTYTVVARTLMMVSGFPTPFEFWSSPVTFTVTPNPAGEITYLHHDLAGSVIAATDANGAVIWKEDYRPYGERVMNDPASSNNRQFFTGKPLDQDTALSYMGARYYDPAVGRFLGTDAIGFSPQKPYSFNRYAYANGNPYRFVDPDGHSPLAVIAIEVAKQTGLGYALGVGADAISQYAAFGTVDWGMAATSNAAIAGGISGLLSGAVSGAVKGYIAASAAANAAKSGVQILEKEGNVVMASFKVAKGEARVAAEMVRDGDRLILRGAHIEGDATLKEALGAAKAFGRENKFKEVVIEGGMRTTGANPGHVPRPITINTGL
jgi:RHS repeat-associated protein